MKRINEKVKDIVEVRKFISLQDFTKDPSATLTAYHFTDATSEMMVKWLDKIAETQSGSGNALALAGYRGVGKSHFLATVAAIVTQPDLRSKIADSHVSTSAQALLRRRYPCILVRRGTRPTLIEELVDSISEAFGIDAETLPDRVFDLLSVVKAKAGDVPFLILADTAMERGSRVARDDGEQLAEIAEAVKALHAFIGVALDDDIAGADGSNAAIVRSFNIDYLDQEHLYKVVDSYVFPKNQQFRPLLHDVYEYFREVMPTFRWSEQRFTSLYPLHPAILDVAPFVRLYVHDFALLRFAAEAGEKILGRPANSLIALDEVFDSAENELRKVEDLKEAFAAYDRLNTDVVGKIPVMQRLQAKLILKALLLLSLEGQGTTAGEICSGTLIFDETDPKKANRTVEEIIRMFAAALPDDVRVTAEAGREVRYGLRVSTKDGLNQALEDAAALVPDEVVDELVLRLFHERFGDSTLVNPDGTQKFVMECQLHWRGGLRRGRLMWQDNRPATSAAHHGPDDAHDWEICVDRRVADPAKASAADMPNALWIPASLTFDEILAVKRYFVLQNNADFRAQYGDNLRGIIHSHALLLDRLFSRAFLEDGRLVIDGFDYNLTEEARTSPSLGELFSLMLEPLFEMRYPEHPYFLRTLGLGEVSSLVSDLYSGSRQKLSEVQQLAQTFALPLGLVKLIDGVYYPATKEQLLSLPTVKAIEAAVTESGAGTTELRRVYSELRKQPFGLVREAQQLILTAMVSQRMIEFVTSKGDRINQRSLDLKIIWDDIIGLARPQESAYSSQKLVKWAAAISGNDEITAISTEADIAAVRDSLAAWLSEWDEARILSRFNDLPEESLNTRIWRSVGRASKTLGAAAALIRKCLENSLTIEECLGRISEAFLDELANLESAKADLEIVQVYLDGSRRRSTIASYLILAGSTEVEAIEDDRDRLLGLLSDFEREPSSEADRRIGYMWAKFQREYSDHYIELHDSVMRSHEIQAEVADIFKSDEWWLFENLSQVVEGGIESESVREMVERLKRLDCTANIVDLLATRPFCRCGYDVTRHGEWRSLTSRVREAIGSANASLLKALSGEAAEIKANLAGLRGPSEPLASAVAEVTSFVEGGKAPAAWTHEHVQVIRLGLGSPSRAASPSETSSVN